MDKKYRPILFQTEMVRAILGNRKSMTRRAIKNFSIKENQFGKLDFKGKTRAGWNVSIEDLNDAFLGIIDKCPYGTVGDILWVRETFRVNNWSPDDGEMRFFYQDEVPFPFAVITHWMNPAPPNTIQ